MKILDKIKGIANLFIYIVVLVLLVLIYFKNIKIDNLKTKLAEAPKIEYIEKVVKDTLRDSIPVPYEVIKWKDSIIYIDNTVYKPIDLTTADSVKISQEYTKIFDKYTETKSYSNILKDDSLAFIQLDEKVQYNSIFDRELTYEHRTPIVRITRVEEDNTFSIVGGLHGNFKQISFAAGVVTKRNVVYLYDYDPFTKTHRAGVYLPIFNF